MLFVLVGCGFAHSAARTGSGQMSDDASKRFIVVAPADAEPASIRAAVQSTSSISNVLSIERIRKKDAPDNPILLDELQRQCVAG